jgi:hypothetical protein
MLRHVVEIGRWQHADKVGQAQDPVYRARASLDRLRVHVQLWRTLMLIGELEDPNYRPLETADAQ